MLLNFYHLLGRITRLFPNSRTLFSHGMQATFFVPVNNHYICEDLKDMENRTREPQLYAWLNALEEGAVFFDVGTSYGQESAFAASPHRKGVQVFGFDCSLYQSHFCALNKSLNDGRFRFVFAAIGEKSGELISITANSDTHIPALHKKNVPYEYEVMTLALDDFARTNNVKPTHIKIDVDGAEFDVLKGAKSILASSSIRDVFIEIDRVNLTIIDYMIALGFRVDWTVEKEHNVDVMFTKEPEAAPVV